MKKFILLLLISFASFSQTKLPETDFFLENGKVYWQHIYEVSGKNTEELIKYFQKEVMNNIKQDNFQLLDNTISFEINDDKINFKKYGGTSMGTVMFIQDYFKYLVVINFKDEKYRVTIKDIFIDNKFYGSIHDSGYLEEYITKKKNTLFTTNNLANIGMGYNHKYFLEKFEINNNESIKKDW